MTPEAVSLDTTEFFAREWPSISRRLGGVLARNGASAHDREDILQETALRLYKVWDTIDQERGVEPFARTVALNVWRDSCRRASFTREVTGDVPDVAGADEVERASVARDELRRVGLALLRLRPKEQSVLREAAAAAFDDDPAIAPASLRMARMRARRHLTAVLRTASALAGLLGALRSRSRAVRGATTATALTTVAVALCVLITEDGGAGLQPTPPTRMEFVRPAAQSVSTATTANSAASGRAREASSRVTSNHRKPTAKAPLPPARIEVPGVATADVTVDIDIFGHRVQVKDRGDAPPVCVDDVTLPTAHDAAC